MLNKIELITSFFVSKLLFFRKKNSIETFQPIGFAHFPDFIKFVARVSNEWTTVGIKTLTLILIFISFTMTFATVRYNVYTRLCEALIVNSYNV